MESTQALTKMSPEEDERYLSETLEMIVAGHVPQVLRTVVKLGVLEIIAKEAEAGSLVSASEITDKLSTDNPNASGLLDRMLSLLASQSILICSANHGERRFGLGPKAKYFVKHKYGAPLTPLLNSNQDKAMSALWYELDAAILEGGKTAFERVHGVTFYEYMETNREFGGIFYDSMLNHTKFYIAKLLELDCYKGFENLGSLVDLGGGFGHAVAAITAKYPAIKGINLDLPATVKRAPSHPGVEHVGGDMFESIPKADAVFAKWIFLNWEDDSSLKLLKNCYKALPENGKMIIAEQLIPEDANSDTKYGFSIDVFMGLYRHGARSRTRAEFEALAAAAGFKAITFECCVYGLWLMELQK